MLQSKITRFMIMINIKYFLLIISLCFCFSNQSNSLADSTKNQFGYIENEKIIKEKNLISILNRDSELFEYFLSIGNTFPIKGNTRSNFKSGSSISLLIKTPYKTPEIFNRYSFNIAGEIIFSKMINKPIFESRGSLNSSSIYILLNNKIRKINIRYGLGFSQLFSAETSIVAPSLKIKADYELKLFKLYSLLVENSIIDENKNTSLFFQNIQVNIGCDPQLTFGFPFKGRTAEPIINTDLYIRVNLFNL